MWTCNTDMRMDRTDAQVCARPAGSAAAARYHPWAPAPAEHTEYLGRYVATYIPLSTKVPIHLISVPVHAHHDQPVICDTRARGASSPFASAEPLLCLGHQVLDLVALWCFRALLNTKSGNTRVYAFGREWHGIARSAPCPREADENEGY
jgi:hypothetical protein